MRGIARRWPAMLALIAALLPASAAAQASTSPSQAEQLLVNARTLMARGDDAAALPQLQEAARLAPGWTAPQASLGMLHQGRGDEEFAREHLTRCQLLGLFASGAEDSDLTRQIAAGEGMILYLVNEERARRDLPMLTPQAGISRVARGHSREMARLDYFSHASPNASRRTAMDRFEAVFGYRPVCIGENLARMMSRPLWSLSLDNLRKSHKRLMLSARHREMILWDRPTHMGVGIAVNDVGDYWVTEEFVRFEY